MSFSNSFADIVLCVVFWFNFTDIWHNWGDFSACANPIQMWLVFSYVGIFLFRSAHYIGSLSSDDGEDFIIRDQSQLLPKWISRFVMIVLFPFFTVWTAVGTWWLLEVESESPGCLPHDANIHFLVFWLMLCYLWLFVYLTLVLLSRNFQHLLEAEKRKLSEKELHTLPLVELSELEALSLGDDCSICLEHFNQNDLCRKPCQICHSCFHKKCIDSWLILEATCPNCKSDVCLHLGTPGYQFNTKSEL